MACSKHEVKLVYMNKMFNPDSMVQLGKQLDGCGRGSLFSVVAHTEWGDIPGKGQLPNQCWFPSGGKEHRTSNFSFVEGQVSLCLAEGCGPPEGALQLGVGGSYMAVAVTAHGTIPGKAKGNTCWYPYNGKEYQTDKFYYLVRLQSNSGEEGLLNPPTEGAPPPSAVCVGQQLDGTGQLYTAVATTKCGTIPGKAKGATYWYPYAGKECETKHFNYVCWPKDALYMELAWRSYSGDSQRSALKRGHQTDGGGDVSCAIAITRWGTIPGKAKDGKCWYSYGSKEYCTEDFYWLCI